MAAASAFVPKAGLDETAVWKYHAPSLLVWACVTTVASAATILVSAFLCTAEKIVSCGHVQLQEPSRCALDMAHVVMMACACAMLGGAKTTVR